MSVDAKNEALRKAANSLEAAAEMAANMRPLINLFLSAPVSVDVRQVFREALDVMREREERWRSRATECREALSLPVLSLDPPKPEKPATPDRMALIELD